MESETHADAPLLDLSVIDRLIEETSREIVTSMMVIFHRESLARASSLSQQIAASDFAELELSVHSIKGSSQTFGANRLYLLANQAEQHCINHDYASALGVCEAILPLIEQSLSALQQQLGYDI